VDCRYHERNRRDILESRTLSTKAIGQAIRQCQDPPRTWINASSATIYRHATDRPMDEFTGDIGEGFSVDVCMQWEAACREAVTPQTRKIMLRTAMVMGKESGILPVLKRLVRFGLGGRMGPGRQLVSWIHETDFAAALAFCLAHDELTGVVNCAAPNPLPNAALMQAMRRACHMPFGLPATGWMLEAGALLLGTETELVLKSRYVIPTRLLQAGFVFRFPEVHAAISDLIR
jgi:uncharacterized protein (TIGR01777 family)